MGDSYHGEKDCYESDSRYCILKKMVLEAHKRKVNNSPNLEILIEEDVLEDITDGCKHNCYLKYVAARTIKEDYAVQNKEILDERWVLSEEAGYEVPEVDVVIKWGKSGLAEEFRKVYPQKKKNHEPIRHKALFEEIARNVKSKYFA